MFQQSGRNMDCVTVVHNRGGGVLVEGKKRGAPGLVRVRGSFVLHFLLIGSRKVSKLKGEGA
jgi:hypothetical protein